MVGYMKKQNGITLIALVVTIIVLIILAGVSISMLTGDNGILTRALEAKRETEEAQLYESIQMILMEAAGKQILGDFGQAQTKEYIANRFEEDKLEATIQTYRDGYNIVYGIYTKKIIYLSNGLDIINSGLAVVGTNKEWGYTIKDDNSIILDSYKKTISGHFDIPNIVDGYIVSELGDDLFNYATNMTSMTLPEGLITIGERTFAYCTSLEWNVQFPSTLESIGEKAFYGCSKITGNLDEIMKLNISYGKGVFMKCSSLTGDIQTLIGMLDDNETVISESLFSGFSGATGTLKIPARITTIEDNAFYGCSGIDSIVFESDNKLEKIGDNAFYQCTGLTGTLKIPNSVKIIGEYAFYENTSITGLDLPSSLNSLGQYAFYNCRGITGTVTFSSNLSTVPQYAFYFCNHIQKIVFQSGGVENVEQWAFFCCMGLKSIDFKSDLENIDFYAFYNDRNVENISFPDSLKSIGPGSFQSCVELNVIKWPANLETISNSAFAEDVKLTKLPDKAINFKVVETSAFNGCTLLGTEGDNDIINWLENSYVTTVGTDCFKNCINLIGDYEGEIYNKNNAEITINGSPFTGTGVQLATKLNLDGKTKIGEGEFAGVTKFLDNNDKEITKIVIPNTVTQIENYAFSGCTSITSIQLPNTITSIGIYAFSNCTSLSEINLPTNSMYTTMSDNLFRGCSNLKNIDIPSSVTSIGDGTLSTCGFETLNIPGTVKSIGWGAFSDNTSLSNLTLNEGIQSIGSQVLKNCALTELTVPDSVTSLSDAVFYSCKQLNKITLGKGITILPSKMLWSTENIETVIVKGKPTTIKLEAFNGLTKLKNLDMDWSNVTKIESKAFGSCSSLTGNIKLNANCSIAEDAFDGCSLSISK